MHAICSSTGWQDRVRFDPPDSRNCAHHIGAASDAQKAPADFFVDGCSLWVFEIIL